MRSLSIHGSNLATKNFGPDLFNKPAPNSRTASWFYNSDPSPGVAVIEISVAGHASDLPMSRTVGQSEGRPLDAWTKNNWAISAKIVLRKMGLNARKYLVL